MMILGGIMIASFAFLLFVTIVVAVVRISILKSGDTPPPLLVHLILLSIHSSSSCVFDSYPMIQQCYHHRQWRIVIKYDDDDDDDDEDELRVLLHWISQEGGSLSLFFLLLRTSPVIHAVCWYVIMYHIYVYHSLRFWYEQTDHVQ